MADEKLEDKVTGKESESWIRKAWDWGFSIAAAAGTTAFSLATVGTSGAIIGGALAAGSFLGSYFNDEDKRPVGERIRGAVNTYSCLNAVLYPIVWLGHVTFPWFPNETLAGKIIRSAYAATAYNAAFVTSFRGAEHLIHNKLNPIGIIDAISDNFYNAWKRIGIGFLPGYALVSNGIHELDFGGITLPTFAWNAAPVGFYNGAVPLPKPKKGEKKEEKPAPYAQPYAPALQPA